MSATRIIQPCCCRFQQDNGDRPLNRAQSSWKAQERQVSTMASRGMTGWISAGSLSLPVAGLLTARSTIGAFWILATGAGPARSTA